MIERLKTFLCRHYWQNSCFYFHYKCPYCKKIISYEEHRKRNMIRRLYDHLLWIPRNKR